MWERENDLDEVELSRRRMGQIFLSAFLLSFFAAIVLAVFLGPNPRVGLATAASFFAGLGWVAAFTGIQYLFEMRSLTLFAINAGYSVVAMTVMGFIIGIWPFNI